MQHIRAHVLVCGGTGCESKGSKDIQLAFAQNLETFGLQDEVMIVETGMLCADEQGKLASATVLEEGYQQLSRIIKESKAAGCKGVFYWEPECKPSQYKLGAFTEDGRPTRIMNAFKE